MATTFPDSIQTFPDFENITSADAEAVKQYQTYIQNNQFALAQAVLQTITNYGNKFINADVLNTIADTIEAVENYSQTSFGQHIITSATQPSQNTNDFWWQVQ